MDEDEVRALAAEKAVIAMAAHLRPADLLAAIAHLEAEAAELEGDERTVKVAAAELLDAGLRRFDAFTEGTLFRRPT
ncbi:MAG: hypothetical protein LPK04_08680 [Caulobacteraceae bacterium]|nr:hypothetical protein [Caulobacteraceae bacterium]